MQTEEFLNRLDNVRNSGGGWSTRCPAHDDKRNSLGVTEDGDKILIHCFAGCPAEDIVKAMGLGMHDLFINDTEENVNETEGRSDRPLAAEWWSSYCGAPLEFLKTLDLGSDSQRIIFEFKDYIPTVKKCRKTNTKEFTWEPSGVGTPWLWPNPQEPLPPTIWITEGEGDSYTQTCPDSSIYIKTGSKNTNQIFGFALGYFGTMENRLLLNIPELS